MSHTISYKLRVADTDTSLGAIEEFNFPISGETAVTPAYRASIDGSYADGTTAETISLGEITTASAMLFTASQAVTLIFGSSSVSIIANGVFFANNLSFTSLKITNASGSTATLKGMVWGD